MWKRNILTPYFWGVDPESWTEGTTINTEVAHQHQKPQQNYSSFTEKFLFAFFMGELKIRIVRKTKETTLFSLKIF